MSSVEGFFHLLCSTIYPQNEWIDFGFASLVFRCIGIDRLSLTLFRWDDKWRQSESIMIMSHPLLGLFFFDLLEQSHSSECSSTVRRLIFYSSLCTYAASVDENSSTATVITFPNSSRAVATSYPEVICRATVILHSFTPHWECHWISNIDIFFNVTFDACQFRLFPFLFDLSLVIAVKWNVREESGIG